MFKKSTWLHLRIPFSFFLLPVFIFALAISPNINPIRLLLVFVALHLFLYPASNGYNSYFDKDEKSIGGLKNPPKVTKGLYFTALLFDVVAIIIGLQISWQFTFLLLIYGLVSKAYSHPGIRLKKYPYTSWVVAGFFQGCFTFLMAYIGLNNFDLTHMTRPDLLIPGLLTSILLWGSYPMTQIYQHEEDSKRGDITLSVKLGIKGTFHFTAIVFLLGATGYFLYFYFNDQMHYGWYFVVALLPVIVFFFYWYFIVLQDISKANYSNTMRLNTISALCLNAFFIYFFLDSTQILQAIKAGY